MDVVLNVAVSPADRVTSKPPNRLPIPSSEMSLS